MFKRKVRLVLSLMTAALAATWALASDVKAKTDVQTLKRFSAENRAKRAIQREETARIAALLGLAIRTESPGGKVRELIGFHNGGPIYMETMNAEAALSIRTDMLWPGGFSGYGLTGAGITIGEWDAGRALLTHQELKGRVTNPDKAKVHEHSTHVAGTIIAKGVDPMAKGMAFEASLRSYDWNNDSGEMADEAADGLLLSNHSYGMVHIDDDGETPLFSWYDEYCIERDLLAMAAPYYLIVQSAGNYHGYSSEDDMGYDTLGEPAPAKNILTVGAISKMLTGYEGTSSVQIADFSSWGPTDDGRIKPDIVAPGVNLYSCLYSSDYEYELMSGTSMASPCTTGSLALLVQHYENLHSGSDMLSSTLKALVIHTADEAGSAPGPDYIHGWGVLNMYHAAMLISESVTHPEQIQEVTLNSGATFTTDITTDGTIPLKVTMVWTDPPGTAAAEDDDPTPKLVNDLDLRVVKGSTTYLPYLLDPTNFSGAAKLGDDTLNNVEQVYLAKPKAGTYTIRVTHKGGALSGGSQRFSLIINRLTQPKASDFTLSSNKVWAGDKLTGTITLDDPAPYGGSVVDFTNSNKACCTVPSRLLVPEGRSSVTFQIPTVWSLESASTDITFTYNGVTKSQHLDIVPEGIVDFKVTPTSVLGGVVAAGTVTIGRPAGSDGTYVRVASKNPAVADIYWPVYIAPGETEGTFELVTKAVSSQTDVVIYAGFPGPTKYLTVSILPTPKLKTFTVSSLTVNSGSSLTGTVTLASAAPAGGATITLGSGNGAIVGVPASITIPEGDTSATFSISTYACFKKATVNVTASQSGVPSIVNKLTINPTTLVVSAAPTSVVGGNTSTGTVTIGAPAGPGGVIVTLSSSSTSVATVPKTVTIAEGNTTANFTITTKTVKANKSVTITAKSTLSSKVKLTVTK